MTTPTPRTPVRLARGLKANLDTALAAADIKEGELVYAKDEDKLYMVEGGVFVPAGGSSSVASIDDLTDVDTTTSAPTTGQVLEWDGTNWVPANTSGGSPASVTHYARYTYSATGGTPSPADGILNLWSGSDYAASMTDNRGINFATPILASPTSISVVVYANGKLAYTGTMNSIGNRNSNRYTFNWGSATWLSSVPDGATLEVYGEMFDGVTMTPALGDASVYDGDNYAPRSLRLYDLADVATSGVTNGQFLVYSSANSRFQPGDATIVGASDFAYGKALLGVYVYNNDASPTPTTGQMSNFSGNYWAANVTDNASVNHTTALYAASGSKSVSIYVNDVLQVATTAADWGNKNGNRVTFTIANDSWKSGLVGGEVIKIVGEPWTLTEVSPTDGQVLTWVDANNQWEPANAPADAVQSVNGQTGVVVLDLEDLDNVKPPLSGLLYDDKIVPEGSIAATTAGQYDPRNSGLLMLSDIDAGGTNRNAYFATWASGDAISFYNGVTGSLIYSTTIASGISQSGGTTYFSLSSYTGWGAVQATTSLVVQNTTKPTGSVALGAADGQVLTWVAANNQWEPANAPADAVQSVNGQTGVVALDLEDLDNVSLPQQAGILMDFDGGNGSTAFTESTGKIASWTRNGSAIQTTTHVKYGASAFSGDQGTASYIRSNTLLGTAAQTELYVGTGDFTIETWIYLQTGCTTNWQNVLHVGDSTGNYGLFSITVRKEGSGLNDAFTCKVGDGNNAGFIVLNLQNQDLYNYDTWHHIAVCRSSGTFRAFVDGTQVGSSFDASAIDVGSLYAQGNLHFTVGRIYDSESFDSYLDNMYFVPQAKYTAGFTPAQATALNATPNTGDVLVYDGQWGASPLRIAGTAPATASDTGTAGELRFDASYLYVCTATNSWKRTALSTWA